MTKTECCWLPADTSERGSMIHGWIRYFSRCQYRGVGQLLSMLGACIACMSENARYGSMTTPTSMCPCWRECSIDAVADIRPLATELWFRPMRFLDGPQ